MQGEDLRAPRRDIVRHCHCRQVPLRGSVFQPSFIHKWHDLFQGISERIVEQVVAKPEVLRKVFVSSVAALVLALCGMRTTQHGFFLLATKVAISSQFRMFGIFEFRPDRAVFSSSSRRIQNSSTGIASPRSRVRTPSAPYLDVIFPAVALAEGLLGVFRARHGLREHGFTVSRLTHGKSLKSLGCV